MVGRSRTPTAASIAFLRMERLHPREPHWYLEHIGVLPDCHGQGVGGALLATVLGRCDRDGVGAWAWTSNPANFAFYGRHGFRVLAGVPFGGRGPVVFPLHRHAAGCRRLPHEGCQKDGASSRWTLIRT